MHSNYITKYYHVLNIYHGNTMALFEVPFK